MKQEKKVTVERCIELEEIIKEINFDNITCGQYINFILQFSNEEVCYILNAKRMPKAEIEADLKYYDSRKFLNNIDELQFITELMYEYNVDKNSLIRRIQDIRRIQRAEKALGKAKKLKK